MSERHSHDECLKNGRPSHNGYDRDHLEIHPGLSNVVKLISRIAPQFILKRLSKSVGGHVPNVLSSQTRKDTHDKSNSFPLV
jgi:hypothetical protein